MMKKIIFLLVFILLAVGVSACARKDAPAGGLWNGEEIKPVGETETIKLYYYNPDIDRDEAGNIVCSEQGLVAVEREIGGLDSLSAEEKIKVIIGLLLQGELSAAEQDSGITTEFPLSGLELAGLSLNDGELILEFSDPENKTVGGSCRVAILWAQIAATARQFPEVEAVSFSPEEFFQP